MIQWKAFRGTVSMVSEFATGQNDGGCYKLVSVEDGMGGTVNFVVSPNTYVVDHVMLSAGDMVTGYYDANAAVPMIFPPQYRALVMVKESQYQNVKVDFFNAQLISSDGQLKLNLSPYTSILLPNGQAFSRSPANRNLIAIYGPATKSIPAQTTPYRIIIWC